MSIDTQLFEGKLIRLAPIDHEHDPEVEFHWTHDLTLQHSQNRKPAMPLSIAQMKKKYEAIEKQIDESKNLFHFTIRNLEDGRLLGFIRLEGTEWTHGTGSLKLANGDPAERSKGYGTDAMKVILRFGFEELNLRRVSLDTFEYNPRAIRSYEKAGFVHEGRMREYLYREGQRWDLIVMGVLRQEWLAGEPG